MSIHRRGPKKIYHASVYLGGKQVWRSLKTSDEKQANILYGRLLENSGNVQISQTWDSFKSWYLEYSQSNKAKTTYKNDKTFIKKFEAEFPIAKVSDLTPRILELYKSHLVRLGKKPATINRVLGLFKTMGRKAYELGYVQRYELDKVKLLMLDEASPKVFDEKQIKRIRESCRNDFQSLLVDFLLYTGMRCGEAANSRWADIDFERKMIRIAGNNGWRTKSRKIRYVPINEKLGKILKSTERKGEYVVSRTGKRERRDYLTKIFTKISGNGSPHWARHTWISNLAAQGVNMYKVQKWAGHSDIRVTEKIYSHFFPQADTDADKITY